MKQWIAVLSLIPSSIIAAPYASGITVSSNEIDVNAGLTISYVLNEPAEFTTITLLRGDAPTATFAGLTARGENSVVWNGKTDNAGGAVAPSGNYQVRIETSANKAAWSEVSSHRSLAKKSPAGTDYNRLFNGFSISDLICFRNPVSQFFGSAVALGASNSPAYGAGVLLDADLDTATEDNGFASRILKAPGIDELNSGINSSNIYGACPDPDNPDGFFVVGQRSESGLRMFYGNLNSSTTLQTADPDNRLAGSDVPRAIVVAKEGALKFAYITRGNYIIKFPVDPGTNTLSGAGVIISNFSSQSYSRGIEMDVAGNLYWICRNTDSTGLGGTLYRWSAAQVVGADPGAKLTENNAQWAVSGHASLKYMIGPAISPRGDVYVAFADGARRGLYYAGSTTETAVVKTLTTADDRLVDFTSVGTPPSQWTLSQTFGDLACDFAGNVIVMDQAAQQMRMYSPPGAHQSTVNAPASQAFVIGAGVEAWSAY